MQKFIGKVLLRDDFCNDTCAKFMKFSKMLSVQAKGRVKTPNNPCFLLWYAMLVVGQCLFYDIFEKDMIYFSFFFFFFFFFFFCWSKGFF